MCGRHGHSGRGAGWQTSGHRTEGKHPDTPHAKHRASRKKPPEGHRCAERSESPAGACPPARRPLPAQEPDKGNPPQAGKAHTTKRAIMLRETATGAGTKPLAEI